MITVVIHISQLITYLLQKYLKEAQSLGVKTTQYVCGKQRKVIINKISKRY